MAVIKFWHFGRKMPILAYFGRFWGILQTKNTRFDIHCITRPNWSSGLTRRCAKEQTKKHRRSYASTVVIVRRITSVKSSPVFVSCSGTVLLHSASYYTHYRCRSHCHWVCQCVTLLLKVAAHVQYNFPKHIRDATESCIILHPTHNCHFRGESLQAINYSLVCINRFFYVFHSPHVFLHFNVVFIFPTIFKIKIIVKNINRFQPEHLNTIAINT